MISRIKGTQDFINLVGFNRIVGALKKYIKNYNFKEIQTPIIEYVSLFQRSLGQETDVVSKEMFIIESRHDNADERMCLRPEMTAPIVRAFNENNIQTVPWKVFSYGPCFRYERPQKGRYRQFHQITMEVIGSNAMSEDVQFLSMLDCFFKAQLNMSNYQLHLNFLGCADDRVVYTAQLRQFLDNAPGICEQCQERKKHNIMRIFDCKNPTCQAIYKDAPHIVDHLCASCTAEWKQLQRQLQLLNVAYVYRATLVRGLDYYNKTVFEFVSNALGAQNAFCGGGRYNQLARQLGAKQDYPSLGAAIGIERLMILLDEEHEGAQEQKEDLSVIIPLSSEQHDDALKIASLLRNHDIMVDVLLEGSIKNMFRKADKLNAAYVIVLGEDEQKARTVVIKTMATGKEDVILQENVVDYFKEIL